MSAESQGAQIIPLDLSIGKIAPTNDYSYEPGMNASQHTDHINAVKPKLLYANNTVRALGGWLMDALKQHKTPTKFMFRVYTHGDTYLMMRTLFQSRGLQTSVRLSLQTNALGNKQADYSTEEVLDALQYYTDPAGKSVKLERASEYPRFLHALFLQHGMQPKDIRSDGQTVTVAYHWEFEEVRYDVHLVSRLDLARPTLDVVESP
jgi:hypothetical protein